MPEKPQIPEPLFSFLTIDCYAENYMLDESVAVLRAHLSDEPANTLRRQLQDPDILEHLSDHKLLEHLTGYGFETESEARRWLSLLYRYIFENGPPIGIDYCD